LSRPERTGATTPAQSAAAGWRIAGGRPLHGRVRVSGSKNGSLPTLAAALLLDGETTLYNVPRIADVDTMLALLRAFGLEVGETPDGGLRIVNRGLTTHRAPADLVRLMRASHYLLAPIVARLGCVEVPLPGGCDIGERPVDYILSGLEALGLEARARKGRIEAWAKELVGGRVALDPRYRSPGATFSLLMAAALARGTTLIEGASEEPDVVSFCSFLRAAGARIEGVGGPSLVVHGVPSLAGTAHAVNGDRLEAGTLLCAGVATRGEVVAEGVSMRELAAVCEVLREAGVEVSETPEGVRAACARRPGAVTVVTAPYPGFPTDLQPPLAAVLATAEGASTITEGIFDRRLQHVEQLAKMGARIELRGPRTAVVHGVPGLRGAAVEGRNIRDAAALVVAALGAEGESIVRGRRFVARGYEDLEGKLRALGAEMAPVGGEETDAGDAPAGEGS